MEEKATDNNTYLAKWIAKEISDKELQELVSDTDFSTYKKLRDGITIYEQLEAPLDNILENIKEIIKHKKAEKKSQPKVRFLYSKLAFAAAASIALFFSISTFLTNRDVTFQSDFGEHKTIALLDGSEVILNAKSTLKYDEKNWKNNREVFLKGEAFFKVQKGSTFNVTTGNGTVSVLGTQFNVNSQNDFFEVICYEGKVNVKIDSSDYLLTSNKSVRHIHGASTEETLTLTTVKPTWILGESSFRSVPLKEVITTLEKQFNIQIDVTNIDSTIIFTGAFDNNDLNIALASVFKTVQIKYTLKNNTVILSK